MSSISALPAAAVASRTAYIVAAVRDSATRGPSVRVCARKSAAVASPPPRTVRGSIGVVTTHEPASLTHTIWIESAGVSAVRTLVTSTVLGPDIRTVSTAVSRSAWMTTGIPARNSSSNWLGVAMSARGITLSRMNSGMPSRT